MGYSIYFVISNLYQFRRIITGKCSLRSHRLLIWSSLQVLLLQYRQDISGKTFVLIRKYGFCAHWKMIICYNILSRWVLKVGWQLLNIFLFCQVDPSEKIQSTYELLVNTEEHILTELKDGAKLSDVYNSALAFVKKHKPELVKIYSYFFRSF